MISLFTEPDLLEIIIKVPDISHLQIIVQFTGENLPVGK